MLPQGLDVGIHRAGVPKVVKAPDLIQKLLPGEDDPLVFRQFHQQIELLGRQADGLPVHSDGPGLRLNTQAAKDQLAEPLVSRAFEHRPHQGHQLLGAEGLGHIVVRPQVEPQQLVVLLPTGGEQDDRRLGELAELRQGLEPVHPRHHHI